jgi:hypothetical protein
MYHLYVCIFWLMIPRCAGWKAQRKLSMSDQYQNEYCPIWSDGFFRMGKNLSSPWSVVLVTMCVYANLCFSERLVMCLVILEGSLSRIERKYVKLKLHRVLQRQRCCLWRVMSIILLASIIVRDHLLNYTYQRPRVCAGTTPLPLSNKPVSRGGTGRRPVG